MAKLSLKCEQCGKGPFESEWGKKIHKAMAHGPKKWTIKERVAQRADSPSGPNLTTVRPSEDYKCGKCGKAFETQQGLNGHKARAHHKKKKKRAHVVAMNEDIFKIRFCPLCSEPIAPVQAGMAKKIRYCPKDGTDLLRVEASMRVGGQINAN